MIIFGKYKFILKLNGLDPDGGRFNIVARISYWTFFSSIHCGGIGFCRIKFSTGYVSSIFYFGYLYCTLRFDGTLLSFADQSQQILLSAKRIGRYCE